MGLADPPAQNGEYTITNLKQATAIADDRLSAHNPTGVGNQTALGDFIVAILGHEDQQNEDQQNEDQQNEDQQNEDQQNPGNFSRLLRPVEVTVSGQTSSVTGSYTSQSPPFFDFDGKTLDPRNADTFTLRLYVQAAPKAFALSTILKDSTSNALGPALSLTASGNTKLVDVSVTTGATTPFLDLTFEVTGFINADVGLTYNDPLNTNADHQGKFSTDGEGNSLPEDAGIAFRTEDVLNPEPRITDIQVGIRDDGFTVFFDFNLDDTDQDVGEGNVVSDPAGQIDGQFFMYDQAGFPFFSFANSTSPGFDSSTFASLQKRDFSSFEGGRSVEYYIELQDQSGSTQDAVQIEISESYTGTWGSTEEQYKWETADNRTLGTKNDPFTIGSTEFVGTL